MNEKTTKERAWENNQTTPFQQYMVPAELRNNLSNIRCQYNFLLM